MELRNFIYKFNAGPFTTERELRDGWSEGNCRRALQLYFLLERDLFLKPEQVLCPAAYHETGEFVFKKGENIDFIKLRVGDIIYAEKILGKDGNHIDKGESKFKNLDDYIVSLHTVIYAGEFGKEIWHATSIEGGSCFWPLEKFLHFYRPVAAKRI